MLLLAIDTAGPDCAVALARSGPRGHTVLAHITERIGRGHAERLMPMIEAALAAAGIGFSALERIAVTTGPGSFTGVRVGIAAARGLALALEIPVVGVGSLAALALAAARTRSAGTVVAALDARRGEIYMLARDVASGGDRVAAEAVRVEDVASRLAELAPPLVLTGAGAPLVAAAIGGAGVEIAGTVESPDIADVATLGLAAEGGRPPVPLYLRGADAKPQGEKALARA